MRNLKVTDQQRDDGQAKKEDQPRCSYQLAATASGPGNTRRPYNQGAVPSGARDVPGLGLAGPLMYQVSLSAGLCRAVVPRVLAPLLVGLSVVDIVILKASLLRLPQGPT